MGWLQRWAVRSARRWCETVAARTPDGLALLEHRLAVENAAAPHGPVAAVYRLWRGNLLMGLDRDAEAVTEFTAAAEILRAHPAHSDLRAWVGVNLAKLMLWHGTPEPAGELLRFADEYFRAAGNEAAVMETTTLLAYGTYRTLVASGTGGSAEALSAARRAAAGFSAGGMHRDGIRVLTDALPRLDDEVRRTDSALYGLKDLMGLAALGRERPVPLLRPVVDAWAARDPHTRESAIAMDNLSTIARDTGDLDLAYEYGDRALRIFRQLPACGHDLAICLNNLAQTARADGDLGRAALLLSEQRHLLADLAPESAEMVLCLSGIATVRQHRGDSYGASIAFAQSVHLAENRGERDYAWALAVMNALSFDIARGEVDDTTTKRLRAVLDVFRARPDPATVAAALAAYDNLAAAYLRLGRDAEVVTTLREGTDVGERHAPDSTGTADMWASLASALLRADPTSDEAGRLLDRAIALLGARAPDSPELHRALTTRSALHHRSGRGDEAIDDLVSAVDVLEVVRIRVGEASTYRIASMEGAHQVYRLLVRLLLERRGPGDVAAAFGYQERCQARSLTDQLHATGEETSADTAGILAELRAVEHRLSGARAAQATPPDTFVRYMAVPDRTTMRERARDYARLAGSVAQLREEADLLRAALREKQPFREVTSPPPVSAERVAERIGAAGRTAAIAYFLIDTGLVVRTFRPDGATATLTLPVDPVALADDVRKTVGSLQGRHRDPLADRRAAAARVARTLLAPLPRDFFADVDDLVLVPDGFLHYLPFELLPTADGRLVAERWRTTYVPSLSVLEALAARRTERTWEGGFVGFGDPVLPDGEDATVEGWLATRHRHLVPLPGTRAEVENIAALFDDAETVLGADFTEDAVRRRAGRHRYVHLATHGLLDDGDALHCGLVVSPPKPGDPPGDDSFLQAYELPALRMTADVVVCSACQTGLGALSAGEGLHGLTQSLLAGGANTVVVSLWPVGDAITVRFMTAFYTALRAGGPPAHALHAARTAVRERHPDPFHWAGFVGVGLGR